MSNDPAPNPNSGPNGPHRGPPEKLPGGNLGEASFGGLPGGYVDTFSEIRCHALGREDFEFLVEALTGREPAEGAMEELWAWLTTAPHDTLFARAPIDQTLRDLTTSDCSWDVGRRTVSGARLKAAKEDQRSEDASVEYYANLRIERGPWTGIGLSVSHFEEVSDRERVIFSASVSAGPLRGGCSREERVQRLVRLCGLSDFKSGRDGAYVTARSATLGDSEEFSILLDK